MIKQLTALVVTALLTPTAMANFVTENQSCGVGKVCLDSSYQACKVVKKKPLSVKKKKVKKKPIVEKPEKSCEQVVNNYYSIQIFEQIQSNVPYSLIHDTPFVYTWVQPSSYSFGGFGGFGGFGDFGGFGGYIVKTVGKQAVTPTPPNPPVNNINTPLPSAFWLFVPVFGIVLRRDKL